MANDFYLIFKFLLFIFYILIFHTVLAQSEEKTDPAKNTVEDDLVPPVTEAPVEDDIEFDENGQPKLKPHPDIDAVFKFTKPDGLVALGNVYSFNFFFLILIKFVSIQINLIYHFLFRTTFRSRSTVFDWCQK